MYLLSWCRAACLPLVLKLNALLLGGTGRLEKYVAKRRRKNAAKDHRYIPSASRAGE
jgi:ribosomal RNA-processing protein 36